MGTKKLLPGILAVLGGAAALTAVYFSFKESPKAHEALSEAEEAKKEAGEEMKVVDKVVTAAPHLKKTGIATGVSIVLIAGSYISGMAALGTAVAAGYAWQKKYLDTDKILSKLSPEVRKKLHLEQAKAQFEEKVKKEPVKMENTKKLGKKVDELFPVYEEYTDQIIWTTQNRIIATRDMMSRRIASGNWISLREVVLSLGGKNNEAMQRNKNLGWSVCNEVQEEYFLSSEDGFFVDIVLDVWDKDSLFDGEVLYAYFTIPPMASEERADI